jgi:type II secretory pathway component PulF
VRHAFCRKVFFSEEKKQKTFLIWCARRLSNVYLKLIVFGHFFKQGPSSFISRSHRDLLQAGARLCGAHRMIAEAVEAP